MNENPNNAVNFDDPSSIAAELQAADAAGAATEPKAKKERKPRKIKVTYTATQDIKAGETIEFEYEIPVGAGGTRGAVAGIPLEEMTDDQLKIEYRNANSVAYKTKKAGRDATKADERVAKVVAEMDKRGIKPNARTSQPVDAKSVAALIASGKLSVEDIQKFLDEAGAEAPAQA